MPEPKFGESLPDSNVENSIEGIPFNENMVKVATLIYGRRKGINSIEGLHELVLADIAKEKLRYEEGWTDGPETSVKFDPKAKKLNIEVDDITGRPYFPKETLALDESGLEVKCFRPELSGGFSKPSEKKYKLLASLTLRDGFLKFTPHVLLDRESDKVSAESDTGMVLDQLYWWWEALGKEDLEENLLDALDPQLKEKLIKGIGVRLRNRHAEIQAQLDASREGLTKAEKGERPNPKEDYQVWIVEAGAELKDIKRRMEGLNRYAIARKIDFSE